MLIWRALRGSLVLILGLAMFGCQDGDPDAKKAPGETSPQSIDQRLAHVKEELQDIKAELAQEGKYDCCVHPTCHWCALHEGACDCRPNLEAGKEVCPGCGLGWHNGQGAVQDVRADQVQWDITHEHGEGAHEH